MLRAAIGMASSGCRTRRRRWPASSIGAWRASGLRGPALAGAPHGRAARRVPSLGPADLPRWSSSTWPPRRRPSAGCCSEEAEKMGALYGAEASRAGPLAGRDGRGVPLLPLAGAGRDRGAPASPIGRCLRRHRRLPRGERGDRQRADSAGRLPPRVRRRLADEVELGRGRVEALAAGIGADDDVLDAGRPTCRACRSRARR